MSKFEKEHQITTDIVRRASEITEWFREKGTKIIQKKDHSPVTLADYACQIFINHVLMEYFPSDQLIAEENVEDLSDSQEKLIKKCFKDLDIPIKKFKSTLNYRGIPSNRQWTIDPIDGTKGFIENLSYAIGIGFMVESEPKVSAIAAPNYDEQGLAIFRAELGQGAEASYSGKEFVPIKVSSQVDMKEAKVCISLHNVSKATLAFLEKHNIHGKNRVAMDGMGKFCKIADGTADFYFHLNRAKMYSWDYCPGELLVREAGGKSTDINNNRLKFQDRLCIISAHGYIFSNSELHESLLALFNT